MALNEIDAGGRPVWNSAFCVLPSAYWNSGRWLSPDPNNAGADPSNPQSWNAYSYAGNNPTTNTDPSGLKCIQLDDGAFADDMTGGGCDKAGVDPNGNIQPDERADARAVSSVWLQYDYEPD